MRLPDKFFKTAFYLVYSVPVQYYLIHALTCFLDFFIFKIKLFFSHYTI